MKTPSGPGCVVKTKDAPLSERTIENPSAEDISAVQVLLKLTKNASSKATEDSCGRRKSESFAETVHRLVTDIHSTDPTMIQWVDDGTAFILDPTNPSLGAVLAKYFQRKSFVIFVFHLFFEEGLMPTGFAFYCFRFEILFLSTPGRSLYTLILATPFSADSHTTPFTFRYSSISMAGKSFVTLESK